MASHPQRALRPDDDDAQTWPLAAARAAARIPAGAALSARPAPPRPSHRFAVLGEVLLALGLASLGMAQQTKVPFSLGGVLATAIALLLLAPVGVANIGWLARHAPLAPRLAMRDLARYRARSGAVLRRAPAAVSVRRTGGARLAQYGHSPAALFERARG